MFRAVVAAALAFAALTHGAPISDDKELEERQFQIGTPTVTFIGGTQPGPTALPTDGWGTLPPITGGLNPPPKEKRDGPVLGGSDPSAIKQYITALELEYEALVQQYGTPDKAPANIAKKEVAIAAELAKYGIKIIATPDGTSTTITFGKRDGPVLGGSDPSAIKQYITALELEYEALVQEYGTPDKAPANIAKKEVAIAAELAKYGIKIIATPDGTSTTITFGKRDDGDKWILFPGSGGGLIPDPTIPGGSLHPSD